MSRDVLRFVRPKLASEPGPEPNPRARPNLLADEAICWHHAAMLTGQPSQFEGPSGAERPHAPIILAHEQPFSIDGAEFRPATREIVASGQTTIIEPRVMQVLVALNRAKGAVVNKDDLAALCWEGRVVGEDAINRVISRLRAVAEKQANGRFRVETITKVGYRLIRGDEGTSPPGPVAAPRQPVLSRRNAIIGGSAIAAVAAVGASLALLRPNDMPQDARLLVDDSRNSLYEGTVDQTENAIAKLRHATQLAPQSAEAWGLLSLAYATSASFNTPSGQRSNLYARAREAQVRAFALEPHQPDALAATLTAKPVFRNWYNQEQACRAALSRHPDHPMLQVKLGNLLLQVGRDRESLVFYDPAVRRSPLSAPFEICHVIMLWDLGRFDEAEAALANAFALMPTQFGIWFTKVYYLMYNGHAAEAATMIADTATRPIGIPDWDFDLVAMQAKAIAAGDRTLIRKTIEAWRTAARLGTGFAENAAIFAAYVGDLDEAFEMLGALYFNRGFRMPDTYFSKDQRLYAGSERHTYVLFRSMLRALRRDPRFGSLTRDLGLDDYWRRTGSLQRVIR